MLQGAAATAILAPSITGLGRAPAYAQGASGCVPERLEVQRAFQLVSPITGTGCGFAIGPTATCLTFSDILGLGGSPPTNAQIPTSLGTIYLAAASPNELTFFLAEGVACRIDFVIVEEPTALFVNGSGRLEQCLLRTATVEVAADGQSVTISIDQELNPDGAADPGCIAAFASPAQVTIGLSCAPEGCDPE